MKSLVIFAIVAVVLGTTVPFSDTHALMTDPTCMKKLYNRMAFRGYQEIGKVDPYLVKNLEAAKTAGIISYVYMKPCFYCGKPGEQVAEIAAAMKGFTVPHLWISVEGSWGVDKEKNKQFLRELVGNATSLALKPGIFTFSPTWDRLMGKDCSEFGPLPLWYIRWNSNPEPNDFLPFGGWTKPTAKQYDTGEEDCSIEYDLDSFFENTS